MNAVAHFPRSRGGLAEVLDALRGVGLAPVDSSVLRLDGTLCRYRSEGDGAGRLNGWLVAHLDGARPVIVSGSWRTGEQHTLALDGQPLTDRERRAQSEAIRTARAQREGEQRQHRECTRSRAAAWWSRSRPADLAHPYLTRKGIGVHGARQSGDRLLIALRDPDRAIWNVQTIDANGEKRFLSGGRIQGLAAHVGGADPSRILLCEGWATGCSLFEATGATTVCAMSAGNLLSVARWLRAQYAEADIVVCADNDTETFARTGRNPGVEYARAAASAIGARLAIPPSGDFNDYQTRAISECARGEP